MGFDRKSRYRQRKQMFKNHSQRQEEIQRKKLEAEAVKENLEAQLVIVDIPSSKLFHLSDDIISP